MTQVAKKSLVLELLLHEYSVSKLRPIEIKKIGFPFSSARQTHLGRQF